MNETEQMASEVARLKKWNKWFFDRVRFMRECQKDYFKARREQRPREECDALKRKSMAVEKEVDDEIQRIVKAVEVCESKQLLIKEFDLVNA